MESAKATNDTTVVVKLEHPVAAFLYNIAIFPAFIVDKAKLEAEGPAYWKHPVGTGPFMVKEFAGGSHITFEKNPYYFEKGKPVPADDAVELRPQLEHPRARPQIG